MEEKNNKRRTGTQYEDVACKYLADKGYKIIERNYHFSRSGEIDIIALAPGGLLVFAECKYRSSDICGNPLSAVDFRKQKQICRTALSYYMKRGFGEDHPCRFDVISICGNGEITHIENAFDFI